MKTFVTFVNGFQEVENMPEAIKLAKKKEKEMYEGFVIFIVEIDETKIPEDVEVEDCIYSAEDESITRTSNW
jgi:hypothetical protein